MKKICLALCGLMAGAIPSLAGGYLTNTNQSVAFLRNPARIGAIGIDGAYSNPAGIGFLNKAGTYLLTYKALTRRVIFTHRSALR